MYLNPYHKELDIPTLQRFIQENPLGILISALPLPSSATDDNATTTTSTSVHVDVKPTIQISHIPWLLDVPTASTTSPTGGEAGSQDANASPLGTLRGHMARPNPHAKALLSCSAPSERSGAREPLQQEVTVLFTAPLHSYVTPKFYTATKPVTGKVVPTWNYAAVEARGVATMRPDAAFLHKQVAELSLHTERNVMGFTGPSKHAEPSQQQQEGAEAGEQGDNANDDDDAAPPPWEVQDAPSRYIDMLLKNIVGVEIKITSLEGKWKMSQEMGEGDREGVARGFSRLGTDAGKEIAKIVAERGRMRSEVVEAGRQARMEKKGQALQPQHEVGA